MPTLQADLELQIDAALAQLTQLDDVLQQSATSFAESLAAALGELAGGAAVVPIEADVAPAVGELDALISEADGAVASVTVDADTGPALSAEEDAVAAMDGDSAVISIEADTTDAQGALDDLDTSLSGVQQSSQGASSGIGQFAGSAGLLAASGKVATGELGGVTEGLHAITPGAVGAAGGLLALVGATHELISAGIAGLSAEQRFNDVLKEQKDAVEQIKVGNLNTELGTLAAQMGSTEAATKNAVATTFQFAINAGASRVTARQFSDDLFALAARAVSLKPSLGDVSDVATRMSVGLGRARSAAQQFGISISQSEINTRALNDTNKQSASELTAYEKTVAGAEIAIERYGNTLKGTIADGSKNAAIQQRQLKAEFDNFLESAGKQLVIPAFDALKAGIPVAEGVAQAVGQFASVVLPVLAKSLEIIGPLIPPLVVGLLAFETVGVVSAVIGLIADGLLALAIVSPVAEGAILSLATGVEVAEVGIQAAAGPIGIIVGLLALGAVAFGLFGGGADESSKQVDDFTKSLTEANGALNDSALKSARALFEERNQIDDLAKAGLKFRDVVNTAVSTTKGQRDELGKLVEVENRLAISEALMGEGVSKTSIQYTTSKAQVAAYTAEQEKLISKIRESNPALAQQLELLLRSQPGNSGVVQTLRDLGDSSSSAAQKVKDLQAANASGVGVQATANDLHAAAALALQGYKDGTVSATDALKAEQEAQKGATDALSLYKDQLLAVLGIQGDVTAATVAFKDSQQSTLDALAKNGVQFDINSQAGRDNIKALQGQRDAAVALAEATFKSEVSTKGQAQAQADADAVISRFTGDLEGMLIGLGQSKQGADDLLTSLGLISKLPPPPPPDLSFLVPLQEFLSTLGPAVTTAAEQQAAASTIVGTAVKQIGADGLAGAQSVASAADQMNSSGQKIQGDAATNLGAAAAITQQKGQETAQSAQAGAESAQQNFAAGMNKIPDAVNIALGNALVALVLGLIPLVNDAAISGLSIGEALGSGIKNGIAIGASGVEAAASAVVQRAADSAKKTAKATSPSQLFAAIGADLTRGLAVGITAQQDTASAAMQRAVEAVADVVRNSPPVELPPVVLASTPTPKQAAAAAVAGTPFSPAEQVRQRASALSSAPLIGQLVVQPPNDDPVAAGLEVARRLEATVFENGW